MEQLIAEIEAYAAASGFPPHKILRDAIGANKSQWDKWKAGQQFPRIDTVDRLRRWMAENPPEGVAEETAAAGKPCRPFDGRGA